MALSVRSCLQCLGYMGTATVVNNLFGYGFVPRTLSLRRQLELLRGDHFHINIILVGFETLVKQNCWEKLYAGIQIMREIFGKVDIGIGKIEYYSIPDNDAGTYIIPHEDQSKDLTNKWVVRNWALDIFVVWDMHGAYGKSAIGGRCTKDSKYKMNGVVVSLSGTIDNVGNTFAHEVGHYMDLKHNGVIGNFMGGDGDSDSWTGILDGQAEKMKGHCLIQSGCPK